MTDSKKFMADYSRGMEILLLSSPSIARLASRIGYPIANETISTAHVQLDVETGKIEFHMSPAFIAELPDHEIAAVIAHELYHIVFNHLKEMPDREEFPKREILIDAQECIINDILPSSIGFATPAGTFRGMERHNQDFANFSSREGYDFILNKKKEEEEQKQENEEKQDSPSSSGGDGAPQDSGDSEKDDEQPKDSDSNGSSKGEKSNEDDATAEGSGAGGEGAEPSDGHAPGCQGVVVVGEGADDPDAVDKALGKALSDGLDGVDTTQLPTEIQDALEDFIDQGLDIPQPGFSMGPPKTGFQVIDPYADLNLNWVNLLAEINPKIKTAGNPKYKDSWHAPRRRMLHSYPTVILPTRQRLDDPRKKGDSIPTFVIALDMSVSIPTHLLTTLAGLAKSVPEKLIRAFPITWSNGYRVFDPERPREIVYRGGTVVNAIMDYAKVVEKDTGSKPYVLVITDGEYSVPADWDAEEVKKYWSWMAIQPDDKAAIKRNTSRVTTDERIFSLKDFT